MFSEILYYICIFPLEQVLGWLLNRCAIWTRSSGGSVILASVIINIILFKLFLYTDKKAKEESDKKAKLDSRIKKWKSVYKGAKLYAFTRTLYRQNHYHPIYALSSLGGLALQIPFFWAMYLVIKESSLFKERSFLWISDLSLPDNVNLFTFSIHLLPFLMTLFTLINVYFTSSEFAARLQGVAISLIFLVLLYDMPSALTLYWCVNMFIAMIKTLLIHYLGDFKLSLRHIESSNLYKWILLDITFMICVFSSLSVYVSGLYEFEIDYMFKIILSLIGTFLLLFFSLMYLKSFFTNSRFYNFTLIIFNILLLLGFSYTFFLTGNYGQMSYFIFDNLPSFTTKEMFIDIFMIIVCVIFGYFSVKFRFYIYALKVLFIVMFCVSCINIYKVIEYVSTHKNIESNLQTKDSTTQSNTSKVNMGNDPIFAFSKTQKNILVLLLDNADGYYIKGHIDSKKYDDIFSNFDGFIFFDNALSSSTFTFPTLASVIGGEYYSAYNINKRNENKVQLEIANSFAGIFNAFYDSGYVTAGILDYPLDKRYFLPLIKDSKNIIFDTKVYENIYRNAHKVELSNLISESIPLSNLISVSVFKFSPFFIRPKVYKNGAWLFNTHYAKVYSIAKMDVFQNSISNKETKPTFKFFHFDVTHNPYYVDSDCKYIASSEKRDLENAHKQTEICSLKIIANVIKEMKKLEIYDNTEIFIVSDHGAMMQTYALPVNNNFTATLFYKPFNAHGKLEINHANITNYDIASIYCENISNLTACPNVDSNILKNISKNRKILTYRYLPTQNAGELKEIKLDNFYIFKGGNIYDSKNWQEIKEIQNLDSIIKETK